jgi:hypothetical protein
MAFRHTVGRVIPRSGCSPAEPASVWPGGAKIPWRPPPSKAALQRGAVGVLKAPAAGGDFSWSLGTDAWGFLIVAEGEE